MQKHEWTETLTFRSISPASAEAVCRQLDDGFMSRLRKRPNGKTQILCSMTPDEYEYDGKTLTVYRNRHFYTECSHCELERRNADNTERRYMQKLEALQHAFVTALFIGSAAALGIGALGFALGAFHGP